MDVGIIAAIILAVGSVVAAIIAAVVERLRRENTSQHVDALAVLELVWDDVKEVKSDVHDVQTELRGVKDRVLALETNGSSPAPLQAAASRSRTGKRG